MSAPTAVYECARCGKKLRVKDGVKQWLYSPWTRLRYCLDIDACGRRARRRRPTPVRPIA